MLVSNISKLLHHIFSICIKALIQKLFFLLFHRVIIIKMYRVDVSQNGHLFSISFDFQPFSYFVFRDVFLLRCEKNRRISSRKTTSISLSKDFKISTEIQIVGKKIFSSFRCSAKKPKKKQYTSPMYTPC